MTTKFRNVLSVVAACAVLGISAGASAGIIDKAADKLQDQKSDGKSEQPAEHRGEPQRAAPAAQAQHEERPRGNFGPPPARNNDNIRRDGPGANRDRAPSRNLNDDLARLHGNDNHGPGPGGSRGGYRSPPPPRVVQTLPPGYRDYSWNGNRYYNSGGRWYRPYGGTYISIGVPFGLFVGTLPGFYSSFWYGGTRYYYSDDTYYTYEPARRGYVVAHSPYGDDEESGTQAQSDDLYIYPARGQTEQQQADDRYQCHRWAAQESHYDPLDDDYNSDLRTAYQRAMTACLTGRGYTVN
ncbi:MAG: DUF6515 family protein [Pseudomonadota bacterium]